MRAAAFLPGRLPWEVKTHTYLLKQPAALTNTPALRVHRRRGPELLYALRSVGDCRRDLHPGERRVFLAGHRTAELQ